MSKKRRFLTRSGIGILGVLCCVGVLSIRLLVSIFPISLSSPKLSAEQPLGKGKVLAFSVMQLNILKPFKLYIFDDANGIRSISQGLMRSDIGPIWSPNGAQIVYKSVSGQSTHFTLVDENGANRREISLDDNQKELLRWSPDSLRLAYLAYFPHSDDSISLSPYLCVIEIATGETHQMLAGHIQDMVWLPESYALLAITQADDLVTIDVYDANANHNRRVSEADYLQGTLNITISPDGTKVAYIKPTIDVDIESTNDSLHISTLDGSDTKSIGILWTEGSIVWSPDSKRIAFVAFTDNFEYALYVAEVDGIEFNLQELMLVNTGDESGEMLPAAPAWSPDGTRIAISSFSSPDSTAVFVMNVDGTERRQIITMAGISGMIYDLAWQP
jgi:Tol biopolymer transport system component